MRRLNHDDPGDRPDELIVGPDRGDDAAVWRLDESRALVSTADFITPVVDDARSWGRIAAANSVSDIYAMGGRPLFALNLVGWNVDALPTELLSELLAGGQDIATRAGFVVAGGHTIDDPEPKYGMAVTGEIHPDRIMTNTGLRANQDVILTKPLGVGILTTAIKSDRATDVQVQAAIDSMTQLNDVAARVALEAGATGCTDVTGFGLCGHLGRMTLESGVRTTIEVDALPLLPGVRQLIADGLVPGGSRRNLAWASEFLDAGRRDDIDQLVVADAQTSGGLVFGVDAAHTAAVLQALATAGHTAARIGHTSSTAAPGLTLA